MIEKEGTRTNAYVSVLSIVAMPMLPWVLALQKRINDMSKRKREHGTTAVPTNIEEFFHKPHTQVADHCHQKRTRSAGRSCLPRHRIQDHASAPTTVAATECLPPMSIKRATRALLAHTTGTASTASRARRSSRHGCFGWQSALAEHANIAPTVSSASV